jgi:DNA-binding CsgD family transcriptional regulator
LFYIALIHPVGVPVQASAAELDNLPHGLTAAEVRTLQLLIEGFGRADIATVQGESERTVSGTIDGIRLKIQASSVIAACLVALKEHLVA